MKKHVVVVICYFANTRVLRLYSCNIHLLFQLNASDDRGIGIVREAVLNFASTRTIFKYVHTFKMLRR